MDRVHFSAWKQPDPRNLTYHRAWTVPQMQAQEADRFHKQRPVYSTTFPPFGPPPFNPAFHADRREQLFKQLPANTTLIIPGGKEYRRNGDVNFRFRQESPFYYLTGFDEPDAWAIFSNQPGLPQYTLLVAPKIKSQEKWTGIRYGVLGARMKYQANEAFDNTQRTEVLTRYMQASTHLAYIDAIANQEANHQLQAIIRQAAPNKTLRDFAPVLDQMRLIKTPHELTLLQQAVDISIRGHIQAMQRMTLTGPEYINSKLRQQLGRNEGEIQAEFEWEARRRGAVRVGYPTIACGGENATVLHYINNDQFKKPGDLVLMDAGAEYGYYTADITRTWPISGKFSPAQKAIYNAVLNAQNACIQAAKPGVTLQDIDQIAKRVITKELLKLGILKGDLDTLIATKAYARYFMHGTSHMLGLDVHDPQPKGIKLQPGMVFTIEPGIYIDPEEAKDDGLDPKWWGIGVRIEDDFVATKTGCRNLSAKLPRSTQALELLMAKAKSRIE